MPDSISPFPQRLRTVFISDIHLGFKGCSAGALLDFLHSVEMDTLFLVGDIVDIWSMKKAMFWVITMKSSGILTGLFSATLRFIESMFMKAPRAATC